MAAYSDEEDEICYASDSEYRSDPENDQDVKWDDERLLVWIFKSSNIPLLKMAIEHVTPQKIYQTIGKYCLVDETDEEERPIEDIRCFKYLIKRGLDINTPIFGVTPLHFACESNSPAIFYILRNGGDPKIGDSRGYTPLHCYMFQENINMKFVEEVLKKGFDANCASNKGETCIHMYATSYLNCTGEFFEMLDLFLEHGFNINSVDNSGKTIISRYYGFNSNDMTKIVKGLFERGFDFNIKDNKGRDVIQTVLHNTESMEEARNLIQKLTEEDAFSAKQPDC